MRNRLRVIAGVVWALAGTTPAVFAADGLPPLVRIDSGVVSGVSADGVERFTGIPYAAPPVGALRWRAPQAVGAWKGVRAADRFGHLCFQKTNSAPGHEIAAGDMSEDCLTVNVFRPAGVTRNLPVMVWIHGGAMVAGSASLPTYDGSVFARGGVILVSFNYRLGRLGIFAHPALTAQQADGGRVGNYALMDQIAALQWVSSNIDAFGGDPHHVTIFGESSGGLCVNTLMVTAPARGLFQRAISESGYGRAYFRRVSADAPDGRESAEKVGVAFAARLGLHDPSAADLRAVPAERIIAASTFGYDEEFSFVLDGKVLTDDMWASFRAGKEAPVPYILGSNSLEEPSPLWRQRVADRHVLEPAQLAGLAVAYGGERALADNLLSDIEFTEQARGLARLHQHNGYATYVYLFSVSPQKARDDGGARNAGGEGDAGRARDAGGAGNAGRAGDVGRAGVPGVREVPGTPRTSEGAVATGGVVIGAVSEGARHGSELRYVFGNTSVDAGSPARPPVGGDQPVGTLSDTAIAAMMNGLWRAFATRGEPTGPGLPVWTHYDGEQILEFTRAGAVMHPDVRNPRLDALAAIIDARSH